MDTRIFPEIFLTSLRDIIPQKMFIYKAVERGAEGETDGDIHFLFYKHRVYKHAEPQILENFKHIAKHAPGSDLEL